MDGGREATSLTDHVRHSSLNASSPMPLFARHGRFAAGSDGAGKEETTTCSGSRTPRAISSLSVSNSIHVPDTGREASVAVFWLRRPESEKARESRERERARARGRARGRERERESGARGRARESRTHRVANHHVRHRLVELGREDREESLCCDAERSVPRLCAARLAARELDGEQLAAALVARHHEPAAESDVSSDAEAAQLRWRRLASGAHGLSFGMRKPLPV